MPGPSPKSRARRIADGTLDESRHNLLPHGVAAKGIAEPSERLTKKERDLWDRVVDLLGSGGIGATDSETLTELCKLQTGVAKARRMMMRDLGDKNARLTYGNLFDRWLKLAKEFGMCPHGRRVLDVEVGKDDEEDPFDDIVGRLTA